MPHYDHDREVTEKFLDQVGTWIKESGEVLVMLRYLCGAGTRDYVFCDSVERFREFCDAAPIGMDIIAFKKRQLPIRGKVTPDFVSRVLREIPEGEEWLLVDQDWPLGPQNMACWGIMGDSHSELREALGEDEEDAGHMVAVGLCPPWTGPDNEDMISAAKGGIDGSR